MEKDKLEFEIIGYFKDFYIGSRYIGSITPVKKDRSKCSWYGQQDHIAKSDVLLDKNKKIPKGSTYRTRLMPLCGKSNLRKSLKIGEKFAT
jgi:hypothetical protein